MEAIHALLGVDAREIVPSGLATLAMALNSPGFTSRPLYITPQFFEPLNLKFQVGDAQNELGVELEPGPERFNEHKLGRTLDRIAAIGPERVVLEAAHLKVERGISCHERGQFDASLCCRRQQTLHKEGHRRHKERRCRLEHPGTRDEQESRRSRRPSNPGARTVEQV